MKSTKRCDAATTSRTEKLPAKKRAPAAARKPSRKLVDITTRIVNELVEDSFINGIDTPVAGLKHDTGKLRYDLIPADALAQIARVLTHGADKYTAHNWRKGIADSRLYSAALRHLEAWREGETTDAESGCYHLAHAACCILFALSAELGGAVLIDDLREGQP